MSNTKHGMKCCKAHCHWTVNQWKHVLWSDESHFSAWNVTCLTALSYLWRLVWEGVVLCIWLWARPLDSSEGQSYSFSMPIYFGQHFVSNFVGTAWGNPFSIPGWVCFSAQSKLHKNMVGWLVWKNLNSVQYLWDTLELRLRARPSTARPHTFSTSEWAQKIPQKHQNIVEPSNKNERYYSCKALKPMYLNAMS